MRKIAFLLGFAIVIFVSAQIADATQVIDDALQVNSLRVGQQGVGGVTYFNGTIINETTTNGVDNPVAFGDNVRIDGRVYRGATAGTGDSQPFIVNDNMEVVGSLTVGSTNIISSINSLQSQVNAKGVGDMLKSTYDTGGNGKIDASKLDTGIAATLIGTGSVSNDNFGYLSDLSLNNDTNMHLTALGIDAGNSLQTTGTDNTLFGYLAGAAMSTSVESVAIGSGAMAVAETTDRNVAIGYNAFATNETGDDNVVIGHSALNGGLGNANSSVAIGNYAMNQQAGGVQNVAVGYEALYSGTNNHWNVGIGYQALRLATGSSNIGIGYRVADNLTTGSNNIIIGDDIDVASATGDYQLNIANLITGSTNPTSSGITITSPFAFAPSADQTRAGSSTITIDNGIVRVVSDGGAIVLGSTAIEDGAADGQIVIIQGTSNTNTVQIPDAANTSLAGDAAVTLGQGDTIQLIWDSGDSTWYELTRSNN